MAKLLPRFRRVAFWDAVRAGMSNEEAGRGSGGQKATKSAGQSTAAPWPVKLTGSASGIAPRLAGRLEATPSHRIERRTPQL